MSKRIRLNNRKKSKKKLLKKGVENMYEQEMDMKRNVKLNNCSLKNQIIFREVRSMKKKEVNRLIDQLQHYYRNRFIIKKKHQKVLRISSGVKSIKNYTK